MDGNITSRLTTIASDDHNAFLDSNPASPERVTNDNEEADNNAADERRDEEKDRKEESPPETEDRLVPDDEGESERMAIAIGDGTASDKMVIAIDNTVKGPSEEEREEEAAVQEEAAAAAAAARPNRFKLVLQDSEEREEEGDGEGEDEEKEELVQRKRRRVVASTDDDLPVADSPPLPVKTAAKKRTRAKGKRSNIEVYFDDRADESGDDVAVSGDESESEDEENDEDRGFIASDGSVEDEIAEAQEEVERERAAAKRKRRDVRSVNAAPLSKKAKTNVNVVLNGDGDEDAEKEEKDEKEQEEEEEEEEEAEQKEQARRAKTSKTPRIVLKNSDQDDADEIVGDEEVREVREEREEEEEREEREEREEKESLEREHASGRRVASNIHVERETTVSSKSRDSFFGRQLVVAAQALSDDPRKCIMNDEQSRYNYLTQAVLYDEYDWPKIHIGTCSLAEIDWTLDYLFNLFLIPTNREGMSKVRRDYNESIAGSAAVSVDAKTASRSEFRSRVSTVAAMTYADGGAVSQYDSNQRLSAAAARNANNKKKRPMLGDGEDDDDDQDDEDEEAEFIAEEGELCNVFVKACVGNGVDLRDVVDFSRHYRGDPMEMTAEEQARLIARHWPRYKMKYNAEQFMQTRFEDMAFARFGIDRNDPSEVKNIAIGYVERMMSLMFRYLEMLVLRVEQLSRKPSVMAVISSEKLVEVYKQKFHVLYWQMHYARLLVMTVASASEGKREGTTRNDVPIVLQALGIANNKSIGDVREGMGHHQRLFLKFLMEAFHKGWRRVNDKIYTEVLSRGRRTNAFRMHCTIEEYAYQLPHPIRDPEGFNAYTANTKSISWAVTMLTKVRYDDIFPDLRRSQSQWSFNQGVYCAEDDVFWRYDDPKSQSDPRSPFVTGVASAQFIAMDFPEELMSERLVEYPEEIRVESFQKIFAAQKFSANQIYWTWALIGRLYYPVHAKDNWHVMLWLKGQSGTGKSTIVRGITNAYETSDVGVLGNMVEEMFGLETLHDKFLVVAPEIKKNFKLDLATFQAMVCGDPMSVARKNKTAAHLHAWKPQLLMCSNDFPNWHDSAGAVVRRIMMLLFKYSIPPDERDTRLDEQVLRDLAHIIVCANRHYLKVVKRYPNQDIRSIVAAEYRDACETVRQQTNPLSSFMKQMIVQTANVAHDYISLEEFASVYGTFADNPSSGLVGKRNNVNIPEALQSFDVTVLPDQTTNRPCVRGCVFLLDNVRKLMGDEWLPLESKYMTQGQYIAFRNAAELAGQRKEQERRDKEKAEALQKKVQLQKTAPTKENIRPKSDDEKRDSEQDERGKGGKFVKQNNDDEKEDIFAAPRAPSKVGKHARSEEDVFSADRLASNAKKRKTKALHAANE